MILRRFMKHVTDQNWFAVGLDVIVVIVGIFLGLQVQAYYEDQTIRVQEQAYLNQLHDEVITVTVEAQRKYNGALRRMELLILLTHHFKGGAQIDAFNQEHCNSIASSHVIISADIALSTLDAIDSSGQIAIIQNKKIKSLISDNVRQNNREARLSELLTSQAKRLALIFPQLISLGAVNEINERSASNRNNQCDFVSMRSNQSFINELITNSSILNAVNLQFPPKIELFVS